MVSTQAFFCLKRDDVIDTLINAVGTLDDITLKYAVHTLMYTYTPSMLLKGNDTDSEELMATPDNIEWMMSKYNLSREEAWSKIDAYNAKYGNSAAKSDSDQSEAQEILAAAEKNAIKRQSSSKESVKPYVPPPRVRDAEEFWPYMRCKNVVKAIHCYTYSNEQVPRSHYSLLEYIAKYKGISVEALKKTHPADLFESNPYIMSLFSD